MCMLTKEKTSILALINILMLQFYLHLIRFGKTTIYSQNNFALVKIFINLNLCQIDGSQIMFKKKQVKVFHLTFFSVLYPILISTE